MKYARCPNCNGRLGIPNKKRGRPISCPKCDTEFVAPDHLDKNSSQSDKAAPAASDSNPPVRKMPSVRAIPLPGAVTSPIDNEVAAKPGVDLTPPAKLKSDDMAPPAKLKSDDMAPPAKISSDLAPPRKTADPLTPPKPAELAPDAQPVASPLDPPKTRLPTPQPIESSSVSSPAPETSVAEPTSDPVPSVQPSVVAQPATAPRPVAKIIKTESIRPSLNKDGKLPTLQLNDELEPKPKQETKSNPALLVAVLGASLVSSVLMLFMFNTDTGQREERIDKTRQKIRVFYEVRPDQEIKPYQNALRKAQLAHSREDYATEIRAYEFVMARFRDEEFNQYSGLTGSQNSDRELEKWVSILLEEAKRSAKR